MQGGMMKKSVKALAVATIVGLTLAIAAPAQAWVYRQLSYPGWNKTITTGSFAEGSCSAVGQTWGTANYLTQTTKTGGPTSCTVSAQIGLWNGAGVTWQATVTSGTTANTTNIYQPYVTRHGVDS